MFAFFINFLYMTYKEFYFMSGKMLFEHKWDFEEYMTGLFEGAGHLHFVKKTHLDALFYIMLHRNDF